MKSSEQLWGTGSPSVRAVQEIVLSIPEMALAVVASEQA